MLNPKYFILIDNSILLLQGLFFILFSLFLHFSQCLMLQLALNSKLVELASFLQVYIFGYDFCKSGHI